MVPGKKRSSEADVLFSVGNCLCRSWFGEDNITIELLVIEGT